MEERPENGQANHEEHVADTGGQERLLGSVGCAGAFVVEPDQQVGTQPHQLPEDEQPKERIGQHHAEHARAEENELGVEAVVAVVVDGVGVHVADGEGVDEQAQERGDEQQHHGDVVDVDAKPEGNLGDRCLTGVPHAGGKPRPALGVGRAATADEVGDEPQREHEASRHDGESDEAAFLERVFPHGVAVEHLAEEQDDREGQHGEQEDVGGVFQRRALNCF